MHSLDDVTIEKLIDISDRLNFWNDKIDEHKHILEEKDLSNKVKILKLRKAIYFDKLKEIAADNSLITQPDELYDELEDQLVDKLRE